VCFQAACTTESIKRPDTYRTIYHSINPKPNTKNERKKKKKNPKEVIKNKKRAGGGGESLAGNFFLFLFMLAVCE
jgi:hypothetical protein